MNLAQLRGLAWGMDDAAVGQAVSRFGKRRLKEPKLRRQMAHEITIVKCCELPRMALQREQREKKRSFIVQAHLWYLIHDTRLQHIQRATAGPCKKLTLPPMPAGFCAWLEVCGWVGDSSG